MADLSNTQYTWESTIRRCFGGNPPLSLNWSDPKDIIQQLTPFMGLNRNHTLLPGGGGNDMESIDFAKEEGCLEFCLTSRFVSVFKPDVLHFEFFPKSQLNSFFLLEAKEIPRSQRGFFFFFFGTKNFPSSGGDDHKNDLSYEEGGESNPQDDIERFDYDPETIMDNDGEGEPGLKKTNHVVSRYLRGRFLIVAKKSIWNRTCATYDGRHNNMTVQQIRERIQDAIDRQGKILP